MEEKYKRHGQDNIVHALFGGGLLDDFGMDDFASQHIVSSLHPSIPCCDNPPYCTYSLKGFKKHLPQYTLIKNCIFQKLLLPGMVS